jgi:repressor LexA
MARVQRLIELRGISKAQVARAAGMSPQQFNDLLHGRRSNPTQETLQRIAAALDVPVARLLEDEPEPPDPLDGLETEGIFWVPVIGRIPAGIPIEAITDFEGRAAFPESVAKKYRRKGCFALRVVGDSMAPTIQSGDIVLVDSKASATNGSVVAVRVDLEDRVTLKRWRQLDSGVIVLQPDNPAHDPMVFDPRRGGIPVNILGRVLCLHRSNL